MSKDYPYNYETPVPRYFRKIKPSNGLQRKGIFDIVASIEKKKPETLTPGFFNKNDSVNESVTMELDKPILAESPNYYKDYGGSMQNKGYFIIHRSITNDSRYKSAPIKYQKVLHKIIEHAAFAKTSHSIGTELINIEIGQLCVSERWLVNLCNDGVKFKEDLIDKNIVHRAVHFFCECGFLNHKVIQFVNHKVNHLVNHIVNHSKTLLTVLIPESYKKEKTQSEPASEPQSEPQSEPIKKKLREDDFDYDDLANPDSENVHNSILRFKHKKKGSVQISIEELKSELLNEGWASQQIFVAIHKMKSSDPELSGTIKSYLTKILQNDLEQKQKEKKCPKPQKNQVSPTETHSNAKSPKDKTICSEEDSSETVLQKFARLNGLK